MAKYFAIRVSSKDQNYATQLAEARKYADIPEENIFCDKVSGRKKERPEYDKMKSLLKEGDEVYFMRLDRIGRDKTLIQDELKWFKDKKVLVRILNVPTTLMEFPEDQDWVLKMVNNVLIEVMSTVAEQEWVNIKKRREAGIAAMPVDEEGHKVSSRTGRRVGRSGIEVDLTLNVGESVTQACKRLGISRNTYYRKLRELGGVNV